MDRNAPLLKAVFGVVVPVVLVVEDGAGVGDVGGGIGGAGADSAY